MTRSTAPGMTSMSDQQQLRRRIAALEVLQRKRIAAVERQKKDLDEVIEKEQRRIENLRQQLTIGVAR